MFLLVATLSYGLFWERELRVFPSVEAAVSWVTVGDAEAHFMLDSYTVFPPAVL